jgi:septum formation protein
MISEFSIHPAHIDESPLSGEKPPEYVTRIAKEKGLVMASRYPEDSILSADTTVAVGRRILGKALSSEESYTQMTLLSGRRHRVYTSVCLMTPSSVSHRIAMTHVTFKKLTSREIEAFVLSKEWENVAVYRHEGFAARFIRSMNGLPSTIAGLPLYDTYQLLRGKGLL